MLGSPVAGHSRETAVPAPSPKFVALGLSPLAPGAPLFSSPPPPSENPYVDVNPHILSSSPPPSPPLSPTGTTGGDFNPFAAPLLACTPPATPPSSEIAVGRSPELLMSPTARPQRRGSTILRQSSVETSDLSSPNMASPTLSYPPDDVAYDPPEPVTKFAYDVKHKTWTKTEATVQVQVKNFQAGGMRLAFRIRDLSLPEDQQDCVAKLSNRLTDHKQVYFHEAKMQAQCRALAEEYNSYEPPTPIEIIPAWVLQFKRRLHPKGRSAGRLVMLCEPFLRGKYKKHNNNMGYVDHEQCQKTPHAFSHFTFELTRGRMVVVDIQGVGSRYTDPQIHSLTQNGLVFGRGDFGVEGMLRFFASHQCNVICNYLGLTPNPTIPTPTEVGGSRHRPRSSSTTSNPENNAGEHAAQAAARLAAVRSESPTKGGERPDGRARAGSAPIIRPFCAAADFGESPTGGETPRRRLSGPPAPASPVLQLQKVTASALMTAEFSHDGAETPEPHARRTPLRPAQLDPDVLANALDFSASLHEKEKQAQNRQQDLLEKLHVPANENAVETSGEQELDDRIRELQQRVHQLTSVVSNLKQENASLKNLVAS